MNKKLENRIARLEKIVKSNRKSTLEQRIARLENAVKQDSHKVRRKKFESFESDLDVDSARAAANRIAKQFGRIVGANVHPDDVAKVCLFLASDDSRPITGQVIVCDYGSTL